MLRATEKKSFYAHTTRKVTRSGCDLKIHEDDAIHWKRLHLYLFHALLNYLVTDRKNDEDGDK